MVSRRRQLIRRARLRRLALRGGLALLALALAAGLGFWLWPSIAAFQSDLGRLHDIIEDARDWRDRNTLLAVVLFLSVFSLGSILPLPIVAGLTLVGGAAFGFWAGFLLSVLATVMGASLSFLIARHLLNRPIRRWLGPRATQIDTAVARNGTLALLSLRLTPGLPFFLLNMGAGVSAMRLATFAGVTGVGVIPNKAILAAAGTQLAEIDQVGDIFSARIVLLLIALALTPWLLRWIARRIAGPAPI